MYFVVTKNLNAQTCSMVNPNASDGCSDSVEVSYQKWREDGARLAGTLLTISSSKQRNNGKSVLKTRQFTLKL